MKLLGLNSKPVPKVIDTNDELLEQLEKFNLSELHTVFIKEGVTKSDVWTLSQEDLRSMGLNLMQRKRYNNVVKGIPTLNTFLKLFE